MEENTFPVYPIKKHYLLVSGITCYSDAEGHRYFDLLWYKDLIEHFKYLKNFTLLSPCLHQKPPLDWIKIESIESEDFNLNFIDIPVASNWFEALIHLPFTSLSIWRAVQAAEVVHTSIVGFPFPLGWLVTPAVYYWKKFYIIVVESAPWRLHWGSPSSLKDRVRANVFELMAHWCLKRTNLAIFTQEDYRSSFLDQTDKKGYVIPASWIDDENIISDEIAHQRWNEKIEYQFLKIFFAGRLTKNKGVLVLLEALTTLDQKNVPIQIDILGEGDLRHECEAVKATLHYSVQLNVLGTIAYGRSFFETIRAYHAVVVPSLSDEQPRIVFDAYSQALPVIASCTPGLRSCVEHQKTGVLVGPNDAIALANALTELLQNLGSLRDMGLESLQMARQMSHKTMHQKRWRLLAEALAQPNHRLKD
jgi:glycosyltransferase involved in cell wall biosynthesis